MTTEETKECHVCKKPGRTIAVEKLPGGGTLWRALHDDKSEPCEWSTYESLDAVRGAKDDHPTTEIRCPECNELGVIKAIHDLTDRMKPDTWKYYISHPKGGLHLISIPEHRDKILKAIGRYIEQPKPQIPVGKRIYGKSKSRQIICPVCKKTGTAGTFTDRRNLSPRSKERFTVMHTPSESAKGVRSVCYMTNWTEKEPIIRILYPNSGYTRLRVELEEERYMRKNAIAEKERIKNFSLEKMHESIKEIKRMIKELEEL